MTQIQGGDINAVLRLIVSLSDDPNGQLTILTMALVVACRSCDVPKEDAVRILGETYDREIKLFELKSPQAVGA